MVLKNGVNLWAGWLGKNDVTWWQANSTGVPPDQKKVNKVEKQAYLSTNIGVTQGSQGKSSTVLTVA